jgi:hypothetical protein
VQGVIERLKAIREWLTANGKRQTGKAIREGDAINSTNPINPKERV